jgi:hypothetical protein
MSARETIDTDAQAASGRIDVDDVDELQQVLQPWDVVLRQMSSGKLHARNVAPQAHEISLSRGGEAWGEGWTPRFCDTSLSSSAGAAGCMVVR